MDCIKLDTIKPKRVELPRISYKVNTAPAPFTRSGIGIMLADTTIVDSNDPTIGTYSRSEIIGITLEDDNMSVIISPDAPTKAYFCGGTVACPDATCEIGISGAGGKFVGEEATATLRGSLTADTTWAVNKAYSVMLNGRHCYLPYQGELLTIFNNKATINSLLMRCECSALPGGNYWSSALLGRVNAEGEATSDVNGYLRTIAGINFTSNNIWGLNVQGYYNVLPIAKLVKT